VVRRRGTSAVRALPRLLHCHGVHRDLRSFPTRRSSDLMVESARANADEERAQSLEFRFMNEELLLERVRERLLVGWGEFGRADRSEEHTSELQSRENLVCRLLLEKKKHSADRCAAGRNT